MTNVLGVKQQLNFTICRDSELGRHNVVSCVYIIGWIKAKKVLVAFVDLVRMNHAKLTVSAGVAKIKRKLPGLRLNLQSVGLRRSEIDGGPRFLAENSQGEHLAAHENECGGDYQLRSAGQMCNLCAIFAAGKLPDKKSE